MKETCCSNLRWDETDLTKEHHPDCVGVFVAQGPVLLTAKELDPVRQWFIERGGIRQFKQCDEWIRVWPVEGKDFVAFNRVLGQWHAPTTRFPLSGEPLVFPLRCEAANSQQIADQRIADLETQCKRKDEALEREVEKRMRILTALPYWMGFLAEDNYIPALVAWIEAHRFRGPDGLEQSWRLQCEISANRLDEIRSLQERVNELEGRIANALL